MLSRLSRTHGSEVEVIIGGRTTTAVFPDFDAPVAAEPVTRFEGAHQNPEDLADVYCGVDLATAIDCFEEGLNLEWLLPNRLYGSGLGGAVPLAFASTATGRLLATHEVGVTLSDLIEASLGAFFRDLDPAASRAQNHRLTALDPSTWLCRPHKWAELVKQVTQRPSRTVRR